MNAVTKALVVYHPWAALIALEEKRVETRPRPPAGTLAPGKVKGYPGCRLEPRERIAIVAAARPWPYAEAPAAWDRLATVLRWDAGGRDLWDAVRHGGGARGLTPLGSILCTARVDDAARLFPSFDAGTAWCRQHLGQGRHLAKSITVMEPLLVEDLKRPRVALDFHGRTWSSPEALLGDYSAGRWGWVLGGVQRTATIPCGRAQGVKNSQGVFRLPDALAEQVR